MAEPWGEPGAGLWGEAWGEPQPGSWREPVAQPSGEPHRWLEPGDSAGTDPHSDVEADPVRDVDDRVRVVDGPQWPAPTMWLRLLGLLALVVAVGSAGLYLSGRPRAQDMERALATGGSAVTAEPFGEPLVAAPSPSASLLVHVAGEVRKPGVVRLPAGARVEDAVQAAGGLRRGASLGMTNLARVVADGERIEVGGSDPTAHGVENAGAVGALLDLNTATSDQLDGLPGVGPVTAAKILAWRTEHGRFTVVDELAEVPGIGPKTLAELRPLVRV